MPSVTEAIAAIKKLFTQSKQRTGIKQEKATGVRWLAMQQKNEPTEFPGATF
ncbi:MAG: hypothetical protein KBT13_03975 [Bacteroidales bacterium]|nr:hypothetical protein [Candidatus Sodaliphilus limicaballi]